MKKSWALAAFSAASIAPFFLQISQAAVTLPISEDFTQLPAANCTFPAGTGPAPDPRCVLGKLPVKSTETKLITEAGVVVEPGRYTSTSGPCIIIAANNVTVSGSEIGPCGTAGETSNYGIGIDIRNPNTTHATSPTGIEISRNVIHDVATGILMREGQNPITIDRNTIFNVRAGGNSSFKAHLIQLANLYGGSGSSKVNCNVSDGYMRFLARVAPTYVDDHISLYNALGTSNTDPIEIAYNKIRGAIGGGNKDGSGIMVGDSGSGTSGTGNGFYFVHHNIIVHTTNTGIGVAGGSNIRIEDNQIDQRGPSASSMTGWPLAIKNQKLDSTCYAVNYKKNRLTAGHLWSWPPSNGYPGMVVQGFSSLDPTVTFCTAVDFPMTGSDANTVDDVTLKDAVAAEGSPTTFNQPISICN